MVNFYINQIKLGNITIMDVPKKWRAEVNSKLNNK